MNLDRVHYRAHFERGDSFSFWVTIESVVLDEIGFVRVAAYMAGRRVEAFVGRPIGGVVGIDRQNPKTGEWTPCSWGLVVGLRWPGTITPLQALVLRDRWPAASL